MREVPNAALRATLAPLRGFPRPWGVAGGWALDLAAGELTRPHADVEISAFHSDLPELLRHLSDWRARVASPEGGGLAPLRSSGDAAPPRHELHLDRGMAHLEVLLEEREGDEVVFRRDRRIRLPMAEFLRLSPKGIPYVAPHWQLLYKARDPRPKDEADFAYHATRLSPEERNFLRRALALHLPASAWLRDL